MKKLLLLSAVVSYFFISHSAYAHTTSSMDIPVRTVAGFFPPENPDPEVQIYPNPLTEGRLTVTSSDQIVSIQVLNITGKMVLNKEYHPGTYSAELELNQAEKGLYLVRVSFNNKVIHTEKIMVK